MNISIDTLNPVENHQMFFMCVKLHNRILINGILIENSKSNCWRHKSEHPNNRTLAIRVHRSF